MRTTLNISSDLVDRAIELTGIKEKTALVHAGLKALIERESARRLADLGGTMPNLEPIHRRRTA
jgi:Arc/MetJ family transcription regulator